LVDDKLAIVTDMFLLGWDVNGETWKWRRRSYAWEEEEMMRECVDQLTNVVLQVEVAYRWV